MVEGLAYAHARKTDYRVDREDLFQEGAESLWKAASTYDPARGSFTTWAFRRVNGSMVDYARKVTCYNRRDEASREFLLDEEAFNLVVSSAPDAQSVLEDHEAVDRLSSLSEREQVILIRRSLGDTLEEIAVDLGVTMQRVSVLAQQAVRKYTSE